MSKKTKKKRSKGDEYEEFTLEMVQELGGTKADFEMLQSLGGEAETTLDYKEDFETEPINRDDIRGFMEEIGLQELRRDRKMKEQEEKERELESKPIKLAVMPGFDDNADNDEEEEGEEQRPKKELIKKEKKEKKNKGKSKIQDTEVSSSTDIKAQQIKPRKSVFEIVNSHRPRKQLLAKPDGKWYSIEFPNDPTTYEAIVPQDLKKLEEFAAKLLAEDTALYNKQEESQRRSDTMWIRTVLKSGALNDKMAALTILIQDSPLHNMASIDTLITMAKKKGRREALLSIETLRDLFVSDLLPDRKLRAFDQHPLGLLDELASGNKDMRDKRLLLWYFEAQLRSRYADYVSAIQTLAHDTVSGPKKKAIGIVHHMLTSKPEQEKAYLELLVNKLGDPDYKVASHTAHLMTKLVGSHPNMKFVVVLEVERLLYRPNVANKAQYYAVCFLNQLVLRNKEQTLAARLITIYFSFFMAYVKRSEVDSKMLSALLMGVNRAYPYAKMERDKVTEQMDTLYKIVHIVNFNTSIQALMLLYHVIDTSHSSSERYYTALYRKLLDPALKVSSKQTMFLNLVFKSMKADPSERRVQAFAKRLLQVCCHQTAPFICAALILVSELIKQKKKILSLSKAAEYSDDEEEHFVDAPDPEDEGEVEKSAPDIDGPVASSWVHRKHSTDEYDPLGRNPQYCHADMECTWELQRLTSHFHPTVALWAQTILDGKIISYKSDPLNDFTLIRFLDRFVYRNPKKKEGQNVVTARRKIGSRNLASVNTPEYLEMGDDAIPADEKFFYRYFNQKAARSKKVEDADPDASDVSDDEFDDYLDTFEKGLVEESRKEIDFASELSKQKGKKKKKKAAEEEEDDSDDGEDLSDEEIDMTDLGKEFDAMMEESDLEGEEDVEADISSDDNQEGLASDDDDDDGGIDGEIGFDEEDVDFSDDDTFGELGGKKGKRSRKDESMFSEPPTKRGKKSQGSGMGGLFAAADEFAHLMDENAGSGVDTTGSQAFVNKDNASAKQLKWEADRDRWMQGGGRRKGGPRKGGAMKGKRLQGRKGKR